MIDTNYGLDDLLLKNFPDQFIVSAFNNLILGHEAYLKFVNENIKFLDFNNKQATACGHLRTLAIEKAFHLTSFNPTFSTYRSELMEVNKWHYKALCLV